MWFLVSLSFNFTNIFYFSLTAPAAYVILSSMQLDQLVIDSAVEKRELEHKHALIQQRVRHHHPNNHTTPFEHALGSNGREKPLFNRN